MIQDYEKRKFIVIGIVALFLLVICLSTCSKGCSNQRRGGGRSPIQKSENRRERGGGCSRRTNPGGGKGVGGKKVLNLDIINQITQTPIYVPIQAGERYEDCFMRQYPELGRLKDKGMGGAKLLGETCADANGNNKSRSEGDEIIKGYELNRIGIRVEDSDDGLPKRINNGDVVAKSSPIDDRGGISGYYNTFSLYIEIENLTSREIDVVIRRGLLLETIGDNLQNLVIRKTVSVQLKAYEKQTVRVFAYCASHHRSSPDGYHARITPFYLIAEESAYYSQTSIWEWQEKMYVSWKRQ